MLGYDLNGKTLLRFNNLKHSNASTFKNVVTKYCKRAIDDVNLKKDVIQKTFTQTYQLSTTGTSQEVVKQTEIFLTLFTCTFLTLETSLNRMYNYITFQ